MKTVTEVDFMADRAHAGQTDKIGVPYIEHVRSVAAGLAPFGDDLVMAGLLHDIIEDTDWTAQRLRAAGIPDRVVSVVEAVTNQLGVPYEEKIRRITSNREATLVKIADNAHNSHPDRAAQLPEDKRARLAAKYRAARDVLWATADDRDIAAIVTIINPGLLDELTERKGGICWCGREKQPGEDHGMCYPGWTDLLPGERGERGPGSAVACRQHPPEGLAGPWIRPLNRTFTKPRSPTSHR